MADGFSCIVIIFSKKQSIFRKIVLPEKISSQLVLLTELLNARKSHPNIMSAPISPLHTIIIMLFFYCVTDLILRKLLVSSFMN